MKPSNCDGDLPSLVAEGNEEPTGQSHPPRCTIVCSNGWNVRMAVVDRPSTSLTIAQQIQSAKHHSVSARTISTICSRVECPQGVHCFVYPLQETTNVCATNCALNGGHGQRNGTTLCFLMNPASACNIRIVGFEFEDIVVRGCRTVALCFTTLVLHPVSWLSQSVGHAPLGWGRDNPTRGLAQQLARDTPPTAGPAQLWQYEEAAWTALPQGYIQYFFDSMSMRVAVVTANNGGYTNY
ncbi:hypothetical protein TNCV_3984681 [Trichonephila clavipes]|nr:hypothetical protein TNCV_3984681 [Trichonephila clavipes]